MLLPFNDSSLCRTEQIGCILTPLLSSVQCLVTCSGSSAPPGFFVLLAMAVYTGVTVNYYGKRYGSWRFSWSYIMGWVAVVLTFFSGLYLREHTCQGQGHCSSSYRSLLTLSLSPMKVSSTCVPTGCTNAQGTPTPADWPLKWTRVRTSAPGKESCFREINSGSRKVFHSLLLFTQKQNKWVRKVLLSVSHLLTCLSEVEYLKGISSL